MAANPVSLSLDSTDSSTPAQMGIVISRPPLSRNTSSTAYPPASVPRMIFSPFLRLFRRVAPPGMPTSLPTLPTSSTPFILSISGAFQRLDLSRDPRKTLQKLSKAHITIWTVIPFIFLAMVALYSLYIMAVPLPFKLAIPALYITAILLPISSQLIWPASPVLGWVILFFTSRFIPTKHRPGIHVALLPALESVLYGANISDLQTRYTHPMLDVLAWIPYGVGHFSIPGIVALVLWIFGPKGSAQYWGKAFGWMNLTGVLTQILFPCAAPWYEIIHGLTPADYSMPGSPGGLLRIDRVFGGTAYTNAFGNAPLVFGAFPSLHSGCAVMEALFLSHFFPTLKPLYWLYTGTLWWATMYLSHHYLIDLTGGACLSVAVFYITMPEKFKDVDQIVWAKEGSDAPIQLNGMAPTFTATTHELEGENETDPLNGLEGLRKDDEEAMRDINYDGGGRMAKGEFDRQLDDLERADGLEDGDIAEGSTQSSARPAAGGLKKPKRKVSWGETKVLGEDQIEDDG